MTEADTEGAVLVERTMPHPAEKIWRALTQAPLIEDWLMQNDFQPVVGHRFQLRAAPMPHWNGVVECEVLAVEPGRRLAYRWDTADAAGAPGLRTVVTWTLTPVEGGTRVRMEQSGFRPADEGNYRGAAYGWPRFLEGLERVAARLE